MTMQQSREYYQAFDLGMKNNRWVVPTNGAELCMVSGEPHVAWGATITIYRSLDGITPYALESAQTMTAAKMSSTIDSAGFPFLILLVTSEAPPNTYANVTVVRSKTTP